jgi:hypothetical protein
MNNVIVNFIENSNDYNSRIDAKEFLIRSEDTEFVNRLNTALKYSIDYLNDTTRIPARKKIRN